MPKRATLVSRSRHRTRDCQHRLPACMCSVVVTLLGRAHISYALARASTACLALCVAAACSKLPGCQQRVSCGRLLVCSCHRWVLAALCLLARHAGQCPCSISPPPLNFPAGLCMLLTCIISWRLPLQVSCEPHGLHPLHWDAAKCQHGMHPVMTPHTRVLCCRYRQ